MNVYRPKLSAALWLVMMLAIVAFGSRLLNAHWLETGFLALLPVTEQQPDIALAISKHNAQRDRKIIWLVSGETSQTAIQQAHQIEKQLKASKLFSSIMLEVPQQRYVKQYKTLFPYRYQLLDAETKHLLTLKPTEFLAKNLATLYSPLGQAIDLEHDPVQIFSRFLNTQNPLKLTLEQGIVILPDGQRFWVLLQTDLEDDHLQLDKLENLLALVNRLQGQTRASNNELLATGMPLFTAYGADSAKQEISTVGVGSSIGIIALMLLTFRSPRPLLLSFLAIGSGLLAALVISVWVFGKIHIITLVFGASLIGVADDYALHFVCDGFSTSQWQPRLGLKHIFLGLFIGLLTNLLSYAGLVFSPFPGLQEVALFSAVGLLVAWLTVIMVFPLLLSGFNPGHQPAILKLADYWQQHWPHWLHHHKRWLMPFMVVLIVTGLWQLTPKDDVRLLQTTSPELMAAADKIKQLLPLSPENQFFLVTGRDINEWHHNEQRLLEQLRQLTQQNKLKLAQGLSDEWPNEQDQKENYLLLDKALYQPGLLMQHMVQLGFSRDAINHELIQFHTAENKALTFEQWLVTADLSKQSLWLGCHPGRCLSRVQLISINTDLAALSKLGKLPGVSWVDQVSQISSLFQRYRVKISGLLASAYLLVFAGLGFKFGWRNAVTIMSVPVFAGLFSLAMSGWFGQLFSLFNLFALLLVLGIGVDDAIFFAMSKQEHSPTHSNSHGNRRASTSLAVTLSALTTLLAFGLLAVSATEVVHAFGFTVGTGILAAFLCSPLVGYKRLNA